MNITITRAAFDKALRIEGKSFWLSQQLKAVQLALTNYALDRDSPALEPTARNNLNFAIYTWKQEKPTEFEKYSGLSRSRLYELLAQGRIKSICLKSHNEALRGLRLVDGESIDLFIESLQKVVSSLSASEAREAPATQGPASEA